MIFLLETLWFGHTLTTWWPVLKTASTILGRLGIPAASRLFPGGPGSFPPNSAAHFLPDSGYSGEKPLSYFCVRKQREEQENPVFGVPVCCRKDGEWGDTARRRSPGRLFLSQPERASLGVKVSRLTHTWGGVAPQDLRLLAFLAGRPGSPSWPTWLGAG